MKDGPVGGLAVPPIWSCLRREKLYEALAEDRVTYSVDAPDQMGTRADYVEGFSGEVQWKVRKTP